MGRPDRVGVSSFSLHHRFCVGFGRVPCIEETSIPLPPPRIGGDSMCGTFDEEEQHLDAHLGEAHLARVRSS